MESGHNINELVNEILLACNCLSYAKYFEGLDKSTFRRLSLKDLITRLSPEEERNTIAGRISEELLRFSRIVEQRPGNIPTSKKPESNSRSQRSPRNSFKPESNGQRKQHSVEMEDKKPEIHSLSEAQGISLKNEHTYSDSTICSQAQDLKPDLLQLDQQPAGEEAAHASSINGTLLPNSGQLGLRESSKQGSSGDSESDSDYEPLFPPESKAPKIVEEVSLESDSEVQDSSTCIPALLVASSNEEIPGSSKETPSQPRNSAYSFRTRKAVPYKIVQSDSDSASDDSGSGDSESDEPGEKRFKLGSSSRFQRKNKTPISVSNPATIMPLLGRNRHFLRQCSYIKLIPEYTRDYHNCDLDDPPEYESQSWVEFYERVSPLIYFLELEIWSWKAARSKCPYNLLKILQNCPNLRELSLNVRILPEALENALFPSRKSLPNLMKLSLNHAGEIIYKDALKSILKAASGLQSFECCFHSLSEANDIVEMLRDVSCLKSLNLRSYTKDGYLARDQIVKLAQISADNLQDLELGNGLWEDVDGECIENLLRRFSRLKKLKVNGNYQSDSLRKPDITISIPPLANLEFLDIGGNYEFASVDQSPRGNNHFLSRNNNKVITVEDDLTTELFSVTVAFPLLPSLKTLILGNLYKIEELHFSSFPVLRVIRVGSPWHLTVKFSENKESRKFSYPLVTDLQLPDCLKDPFFVQNIPARFPNLKKCWIFLPSVKVLRTFFKTMEKSGLEELYLKTQFDFEVTMELCLLGQPSKALKNYRDYMRYEDLEKYDKFQEFVQFHNIELPPKKIEDMQELEDNTCAGLKALRKLKILQLEHVPRILLIPKGNLHWTHVNAEFTNHCIGFKQYPLSGNCLRQLPVKNLKSCTWPNFIVSGEDAQVLYQKGFEGCGDEDVEVVYDEPGASKTQRRSGVDRRGEKLKVAIQPAMLQASLQFREKKEQK